ncbi:glycosyltransferase [Candidatus Peribacteria bacterium]|nr:glycosyltransferase [Candidatus Peribacteria bacterium]
MRILFITQKLKEQDAFGVLWVRELLRQGFEVTVICLEGSGETFEFPVHSLGKESGLSKLQSIVRFEKLIATLPYDRVFVHMAPVWYALGFWLWAIKRVPTYLWYTHYKMQLGVRLFGWFGTRFFCATPQSLPQYDGSPKKTVVGHGIDLSFWPKRRNLCMDSHRLLVVHRLSRSKRLELSILALPLLDSSYTIDVYGNEAEPDYAAEMKSLVEKLKLQSRVTFHGTVPMQKLPEIYSRHRLILNMASETIDKTMLEAMTCGCYPVTTLGNAVAIASFEEGEVFAPRTDTPETIAAFIRQYAEKAPIDVERMYEIVSEYHSLSKLVEKMGQYIRRGM